MVEQNDIREKSTIGHELGHYVTQGDLYIKDINQLSFFDDVPENYSIVCRKSDFYFNGKNTKVLYTKEDWREWQANYFGCALAVPKKALYIKLDKYFQKYKNIYGNSILDNLGFLEYNALIYDLANTFNVSNILIQNRLKSLNLVSEKN